MTIENFGLDVFDELLDDLSMRLKNTKRTNGRDNPQWEYDFLKRQLCISRQC